MYARFLLVAILAIAIRPAFADCPEPCQPAWMSHTFCPRTSNGPATAMLQWDDGSGEAVYVAWAFTSFGCGETNIAHIARWNGSAWYFLTQGGSPMRNNLGAATIRSLVVHDDGTGPALYAGGDFTHIGELEVNGIARWDGVQWSAVGGAPSLGGDSVYAIASYDDGSGPALYIAGDFTHIGEIEVNGVARWDGAQWSALAGPGGIGVDGRALALAVYDEGDGPALFVGGSFPTAGGVAVGHIARWDGNQWSALEGSGGTGLSGVVAPVVNALIVFNDGSGPSLFIGGNFIFAGDLRVNRVAKWNGQNWLAMSNSLATGVGNIVLTFAVFNDASGPALAVGGWFTTAGGVTVNRVAKWNGTFWSALTGTGGTGTTTTVRALASFNSPQGSQLIVGGDLTATQNNYVITQIRMWSGTAWTTLPDPTGTGMNNTVFAFAYFDDGTGPALYAGGGFTIIGGTTVNRIAKWNGSQWLPLVGPGGTGTNGSVRAMTVFDDGNGPALYVAGDFSTAGGITVNRVARWNGSQWSSLTGPAAVGLAGSGSQAIALAVFDDGTGPALYAGGVFTTAGGETANNIARWDGKQWSTLTGTGGIGVNSAVNTLLAFDDGSGPILYAGGAFTTAAGVTVNRIAGWDGKRWYALTDGGGTGVSSTVTALAAFDDGLGIALYVGGSFASAGGITANRIAKWDEAGWSPLYGPGANGVTSSSVLALSTFDDGTGTALYAAGNFVAAGGITSNYIARWNRNAWSPLQGLTTVGTSAAVHALITIPDPNTGLSNLYLGGEFLSVGGYISERVAQWNACPPDPSCGPADLNCDTLLDFFDVQAFLNAYASGSLAADFNDDGILNFFDVQAFLSAFAAGCP
ncbi:MAG: hypothetical protein KF757_13900 [Phycisphaeraceae bacterium]|nr:hypothetical protein [Phycisphaeraceae bacterium]MCW5764056.1 hypothetical protein [Phycisphaeraceae bacterium]